MKRTLILLILAAPLMLPVPGARAQKMKIPPARARAIKKSRASFEACRKEALAQFKSGSLTKKAFESGLMRCKESYPGAGLYTDCKRKAIRTARDKNISPDKAVEQCKRYLLAASFDPKDSVPFFIEGGKIFFAGVGLNRPTTASNLQPPNFDCDKLAAVAKSPEQAQYFLFGNHPSTFSPLNQKGPALAKALGFSRPRKKGFDINGFGRLFGDPSKSNGMVFFPTSACEFDAELGEIFAGLSAYYLIDAASSGLFPYFGIAYFKQRQTEITTSKLIQRLIKLLGPNFKAQPKNSLVTFIAAAPLAEQDEEKDPKNLCQQPRQHRFVAVVQSRPDGGVPEYMLIANVKNLCDFGDRLAKRLVE